MQHVDPAAAAPSSRLSGIFIFYGLWILREVEDEVLTLVNYNNLCPDAVNVGSWKSD